jgi:flagellin-like hook-associated protein FlgL
LPLTIRFSSQTARGLTALGLLSPLTGCYGECGTHDDRDRDRPPWDDTDAGDGSVCADLAAGLEAIDAGLSVIDRADSAGLAAEDLMLRIRALALASASDPTSDTERGRLQAGYETLDATLDALAGSTTWDGVPLTDGSLTTWEVALPDRDAPYAIALADLTAAGLGVDTDSVDLTTAATARSVLGTEQAARAVVVAWRDSLAADHAALEAVGAGYAAQCGACDEPCPDLGPHGASFDLDPEEAEAGVLAALADNLGDGIALTEAALDGAEGVEAVLPTLRDLAVLSASETLEDGKRAWIQAEFETLSATIDAVATNTHFNGFSLTDGSFEALEVQFADANSPTARLPITLHDLTAASLGVDTGAMDLSSASSAQTAIDSIDTAISSTLSFMADFGAVQAALEVLLDDVERRME